MNWTAVITWATYSFLVGLALAFGAYKAMTIAADTVDEWRDTVTVQADCRYVD